MAPASKSTENPTLSRRAFIQTSGLALSALAAFPLKVPHDFLSENHQSTGLARVAVEAIYSYGEPSFSGERLGILRRDEILKIYEEINSSQGPVHNPRWYRLEKGYAHSGPLQRVDGMHLNIPPLSSVPESGQLGEITVPFVRSYRRVGSLWQPLYRLYYGSVHWITAVMDGPNPGVWYRLTDDLLHVHYLVPATHVRPIVPEELSPLSPDIAPHEKRIEVILEEQTLTAYESERAVFTARVSTGIPTKNPLPRQLPIDTPSGRFHVQTKWPVRHMGDGKLTSDILAYELPGVPWVCIFQKDGIALHGTYWHDNFGRRMSHGCINLRSQDARWLYRWTTPIASPQDWYVREMGTLIDIV